MADTHRIKVVYMGTPDFAVGPLRALCETVADVCQVVGVVTAPDRPAGRGQQLRLSAVKEYITGWNAERAAKYEEQGTEADGGGRTPIVILQPERLKNPAWLDQLRALDADLFVVVAFRMLPEVVFAMPRLGTFNLHGSLLPQYRGAAPINWALINGEPETGVTTFFIDHAIDCGQIIDQRTVPIEPQDHVGTLHDKLCAVGSALVADTVRAIAKADIRGERIATRPQPVASELKPAPKIFKEDGRLDWNQTGERIILKIRGLSPYPAAWAEFQNGLNTKILQARFEAATSAECGTLESDGKHYLRVAVADGWVYIEQLHPQGKRAMGVEDFLRGVRPRTR